MDIQYNRQQSNDKNSNFFYNPMRRRRIGIKLPGPKKEQKVKKYVAASALSFYYTCTPCIAWVVAPTETRQVQFLPFTFNTWNGGHRLGQVCTRMFTLLSCMVAHTSFVGARRHWRTHADLWLMFLFTWLPSPTKPVKRIRAWVMDSGQQLQVVRIDCCIFTSFSPFFFHIRYHCLQSWTTCGWLAG